MPEYKYVGRTLSGQPVNGVIEAATAEDAQNFLRKQRVVVDSLKKKQKDINIKFGTGVPPIEISRFTRQFSTMIEAGLPLVQCLEILGSQATNPNFSFVINSIRESVSSGSTLASAMGKHKKIFDELFVNMIEAGEVSGALETVLKRLAVYREKADKLARDIKGAMIYPAVMASVCVLVTWIMLVFILPIFAGMFDGLGAELPGPTKFVMRLSEILRANFIPMVIGVAAVIVTYKIIIKKDKAKFYRDKLLLKSPVFGDLLKKTAVARFCRTLGTLLQSGVPLIESLNVTAKTAGNFVIMKAIRKSILAISEGETISAPLEESGVFPQMVLQMINIGEQTGNLDEMLTRVADFYDEEVDAAVKNLTSMIEPLVIIVMGVVIGGLLIAMYLPLFDIVGQIK